MFRHFSLSSFCLLALTLTGCSARTDTIPYFPEWEGAAETEAPAAEGALETPEARCRGRRVASQPCERLGPPRGRFSDVVVSDITGVASAD
jgi:hypothetical protein